MLASVDQRLVAQTQLELVLAEQGKRVSDAFSAGGVRWAMVKGEVFSRRLYPHSTDRPFNDIDILVPFEDLEKSSLVLTNLGFHRSATPTRDNHSYRLDKWTLPGNESVLIEIQTNLIRSPSLRGAIGLGYEELLAAGHDDPEDATALLLVAAVHGAAIHQFDRLQHVIDILQSARGAAGALDMSRLVRIAHETGSTVALQTALDLTATVFDEVAPRALADQLTSAPWRRPRRWLLTPKLVFRARTAAKKRDWWRRRIVREIIKLNGRYERRNVDTPATHIK
jgi:hypothetical protein